MSEGNRGKRGRGRSGGRGRAIEKKQNAPTSSARSLGRSVGVVDNPPVPPQQQFRNMNIDDGGVAPPPQSSYEGNGRNVGRSKSDSVPGQQQQPPQQGSGTSSGYNRQQQHQQQYQQQQKQQPPQRGSSTSSGNTQLKFTTNNFLVKFDPNFAIHHYHIDFEPEIDSTGFKRRLVKQFRERFDQSGCGINLCDGNDLYVVANKLPGILMDLEINMRNVNYNLKFKFTDTLKSNCQQVITILNSLQHRHERQMGLQEINKYLCDMKNCIIDNVNKMNIYPAILTSINEYRGGILFNIDLTHRMLNSTNVLDYMKEIECRFKSQHSNRTFFEEVELKLLGKVCRTIYKGECFRVDSIDWKRNPMTKFTIGKGTTKERDISLIEYINERYPSKEYQITDNEQPWLISNPKKRDILNGIKEKAFIPELCQLTGMSDELRNNMRAKVDIMKKMQTDPKERFSRLMEIRKTINDNDSVRKEMKDWMVDYSKELVVVNGEQLKKPGIMMRKNDIVEAVQFDQNRADFSTSIIKYQLFESASIHRWLFIFDKGRDEKAVMDYMDKLMNCINNIGMKLPDPQIITCRLKTGKDLHAILRNNYDANVNFIHFVLNFKGDELYSVIKKFCFLDNQVPCQCVVKSTLNRQPRQLNSIVKNLAIQINYKLGGLAWVIKTPFTNRQHYLPTMLVGIDTFHDTANKKQSIGAFVSTYDIHFSKVYSHSLVHKTGQELLDKIHTAFRKSILNFVNENNGQLPVYIIVYRDGLGDSQLKEADDVEIKQFDRVMEEYMEKVGMKLVYIVVKKRIATRLLQRQVKSSSFGGGGGEKISHENPVSGSVVDKVITRKNTNEFFLVSQWSNQGTISPTNYNVFRNDVDEIFTPKFLQQLTYCLCFNYANWQGAVSVPSVCMYAHKLAFLTGQTLKRDLKEEAGEGLRKTPFFL